MSFTFYVLILAFGNLVGAFGSVFAGLTDRFGRANLVVFGLLFTGVFVGFIMPAATNKWAFGIEFFVVGFVEGVCLVATPALIRDFSPQVGRATAMGFWTSGPVVGSLIVAVVGSATIPAIVANPHFWTHEYRISGIAGLVVFVIAFIWLREARNPALTATGLAIWGWIIRVVVLLSFLLIPLVINSVTPLVNYGSTVSAYATQYKSQLAFASTHPTVVAAAQKVPPSVVATAQSIPPAVLATAQKIPPSVLATAQANATQLANAQKFAPELAVIQARPTLFAKLATYKNPATIPPTLVAQAVAAAGGGAKGLKVLTTISANQAAITGVIAAAPALKTVAPYAADLSTITPYSAQLKTIAPYSAELTTMAPYGPQLTALSKVPPGVIAYLNAHGAAVTKAAAQTASQWKTWY